MSNRITKKEIKNIINTYNSGKSVDETSISVNKNPETVKKYIHMYGQMRTRSHSAKIRPKRTLTVSHKNKIGDSNKNKKRTVKTITKLRKAKIGKYGKKSNNWKGGKTSLNKLIRHNFKNKSWIIQVFKCDDYTCQLCKKRGGNLEAHHIKMFSTIVNENNIKTINDAIFCDELWNIENGITLCKCCHKTVHKKKR